MCGVLVSIPRSARRVLVGLRFASHARMVILRDGAEAVRITKEAPSTHRASALDVDGLLEQAEEFVRAGDYLEARVRTRRLRDALPRGAEARVARALRRDDLLVEGWQAENAARSAAYVARERKAIGGDRPEPADVHTGWSRAKLATLWRRCAPMFLRRLPAPPAARAGGGHAPA